MHRRAPKQSTGVDVFDTYGQNLTGLEGLSMSGHIAPSPGTPATVLRVGNCLGLVDTSVCRQAVKLHWYGTCLKKDSSRYGNLRTQTTKVQHMNVCCKKPWIRRLQLNRSLKPGEDTAITTTQGRVVDDSGMVFFNAPEHSVRIAGQRRHDLPRTPWSGSRLKSHPLKSKKPICLFNRSALFSCR